MEKQSGYPWKYSKNIIQGQPYWQKKSKNLEEKTLPFHSKTTKHETNGQNQLSLIVGVLDLDGIRVEE